MKEKIKVAFIETNCKNTGPIKQILNLIEYLNRDIFEPVLITLWEEDRENTLISKYEQCGVSIYSIGINKVKSVILGSIYLKKILFQVKPDIIHTVGMPLYRMSLGYKSAVQFTTIRNYCLDDYPDYYGSFIGNIMALSDIKLIKRQIGLGKSFVTCSESLSKIYFSRHGINMQYIRNGVDIRNYPERDISKIAELRERLNLPQNKTIFVYSGSFIERKNQREAISAFINMKKRKDSVILFLGSGTDFDSIKSNYKQSQDILFRGQVSNVNEYLQASDIYISTSKSEGLPNGVLEAMSCGLPVLLSNIQQHLEILKICDECGHLYRLGEISELSECMDQMIDENLLEMGKKSRATVIDNFTAEVMSNEYQGFYINLVKGEHKNADIQTG